MNPLFEKSKEKKERMVKKVKRKTLKLKKKTEKEDSSIVSSNDNEDIEL